MQPVVSVKNIDFFYNSEFVLKDVSFELKKGDYLGIVGPNGSGKTTLVRLILGYLRPKRGEIEVFGKSPKDLKTKSLIGYLPQIIPDRKFHFPLTVMEVVLMGLVSQKSFPKLVTKKDVDKATEVLKMMNVLDLQKRLIGELSGGERQKVFLCRALVHEPELLILDEPVSALDPESRGEFYVLLERLRKERETTIIMVTHDAGEIGNYATKLLYLDRRVIFFGSFEKFCESEEMTKYFGEHSQHLICHRHNRKKAWLNSLENHLFLKQ
ncbi:MAG: metal ABC transporter ATP-binding protein [Desulfobacterota bacterium]|nr:metal ABC transporter ATP-binding protein [Thermodesulfobacteriota bacterium]MDW8001682.1 metal ABC transporter ATP-binding protein [Deltaproteobacteria bacterium]